MARRPHTKPGYSIIAADPPWPFRDKLPGDLRGAASHYKTMNLGDIQRMPQERGIKFAPDALLFLWRVAAMVEEAIDVCKVWGFVPKSEIVWVKTTSTFPAVEPGLLPNAKLKFGMGRYTRHSHEVCIIAARRGGVGHIINKSVRSVFFAPATRHSEKPQEFYDLVEKMTGTARGERNLELWARKMHAGWDAYGDQVE